MHLPQDRRRVPETRRPLAQRRPPQLPRPRRQGRRRGRARRRDPAELGDAALRHPRLWEAINSITIIWAIFLPFLMLAV